MPKSFQKKYPNSMKNLRLNSRKLTTPFDVHETLKHFLNFHSENEPIDLIRNNFKNNKKRGFSLLSYIPIDRSCEDAHIEAHWCSCLNWVNVNITSNDNIINKIVNKESINESIKSNKTIPVNSKPNPTLRIANKAVEFINSLNVLKAECEEIYLKSIESVSMLNLNEKLLAFKESKDLHGREPVFEYLNNSFLEQQYSYASNLDNFKNRTNLSFKNMEITFQIVLTTWPGKHINENMKYELTFKYDKSSDQFRFGKNEISRINNYHNSSYCILNKRPDLRQFCYCK